MPGVLSIFDFDDTLITSTAKVRVVHKDGTEEILNSSAEYANYRLRPGDEFDYGDFDIYPPGAEPIGSTFLALKSAIDQGGAANVVILTARSADKPVRKYLSDQGISGVEIQAVGDSNPMAKARYVIDRLKAGDYDAVHVYEDNARNIRAIKKVVTKAGIRFRSTMVMAEAYEKQKVLREFIERTLDMHSHDHSGAHSAGIVVLKRFEDGLKVLCLEEENTYDLTKGGIDPGETSLEAAIRETFEESSIDRLIFSWGEDAILCGQTMMYVAETDQDPKVTPNPHTGELEHLGASWLSWDEAIRTVKPWLSPSIVWARKTTKGA